MDLAGELGSRRRIGRSTRHRHAWSIGDYQPTGSTDGATAVTAVTAEHKPGLRAEPLKRPEPFFPDVHVEQFKRPQRAEDWRETMGTEVEPRPTAEEPIERVERYTAPTAIHFEHLPLYMHAPREVATIVSLGKLAGADWMREQL